jgi:hypothetical protein
MAVFSFLTICNPPHLKILGVYCNHYFLRMLASIGKGHYDAALETGTEPTSMFY